MELEDEQKRSKEQAEHIKAELEMGMQQLKVERDRQKKV